jgi:Putative porin
MPSGSRMRCGKSRWAKCATPGCARASAFYTQLAERNAAAALIGQTSLADSNMVGAQVGWRSNPAQPTKFMIGASYYAYGAVKGYNAFYDGSAFGNTTTTSAAVCRKGIATCLASDFSIIEGMGEFATVLGGYPFTAYADYMKNTDATTAYDTAYSVGFQYGRASAPRSWEFGLAYQKVEKDSQFGQYVDSDFGAGNTDVDGFMLKAGYQFAKNWRVNGTYFLNKTNNDVGATIAGVGTVFDRNYKRLQLDLNMTF